MDLTAYMNQYFNKAMDIINKEIFDALAYLGEECVSKIRNRSGDDSWFDQTGNLRSSIGYAIYNDGKVLMESAFNMIKNGTEGQSAGEKMVADLASKYASTYALVVVAGMNYAEYVEARDNKDVLAQTELWARSVIDSYLEKAKQKALKKIEAL
jgi:hypothetical protein